MYYWGINAAVNGFVLAKCWLTIGEADRFWHTGHTFEIRKRAIVSGSQYRSAVPHTNHQFAGAWVPPPGGNHKGRSETYGKTVALCQIWEVWGEEPNQRCIPPCNSKGGHNRREQLLQPNDYFLKNRQNWSSRTGTPPALQDITELKHSKNKFK